MTGMLANAIRWLLVPVAAAAMVAGAVIAARWAVSMADGRCPPASMVGGSCVEPWHTTVVELAFYAATVLAAAGVVILPAIVAPRLKRSVAVTAFVLAVGSAIAVHVAAYRGLGWSELLTPVIVVAAIGAAAVWWVCARRSANAS